MNKVAALGPSGTFTEAAAKKLFPKAEIEYRDDVEDVFRYVSEGSGFGVAAVENSLEGSVGKTLESLMKYDLYIMGEVTLDIKLHLMAGKGVQPEKIKTIISHPHVFGQCKQYLQRNYPQAKLIGSTSTAEAIKEVSARKDAAAIGFKDTGLAYGLQILAENIQDNDSQTKFIALSKTESDGPKTSLIFATNDEPGALYGILKLFADGGINLTKIESRPSRRKLGEYVYYLDYVSRGMSRKDRQQLHERIGEKTTLLKNLGSY
jgi:prephenate dehydratase